MCDVMLEGDGANQKRCTVCGRSKPMDCFSPMARGAGGRHPRCKDCRNRSAAQKRNEGLAVPLDRRFTRSPQPFEQCDDGTYRKIQHAPPPARARDLNRALRDFLHRVARPGDAGNVTARIQHHEAHSP